MVTCKSANQLKTPAKVSWVFKMVSQFGSLGYTIMGLDCWSDSCPEDTNIHYQRSWLFTECCIQACQQKVECKEKVWKKKMQNQPREPQPYEDRQTKSIQEFVWTSQGMDWGGGQGIKSTTHSRVEEFGYSCLQRRLTWTKEKKNWTVAQWSKVLFQMRASFVFHLETKVLESGGKVEKLIAQVAWSPVLSFHSLWWGAMSSAGVGPLCFLKTNVTAPVYQEILEHFMLPSADQLFKDADFIFQQDLAPAHTAKSTKSWLNDQQTHQTWTLWRIYGVLSRGKWETRDKKIQMSWRPLSKKPGLHTTSAVPQTDHLHATPNWDSN